MVPCHRQISFDLLLARTSPRRVVTLGEEPPKLPNFPKRKSADDIAWGSEGKDARYPSKLRRLFAKTQEGDRKLLPYLAQKMAGTRSRRTEASN